MNKSNSPCLCILSNKTIMGSHFSLTESIQSQQGMLFEISGSIISSDMIFSSSFITGYHLVGKFFLRTWTQHSEGGEFGPISEELLLRRLCLPARAWPRQFRQSDAGPTQGQRWLWISWIFFSDFSSFSGIFLKRGFLVFLKNTTIINSAFFL